MCRTADRTYQKHPILRVSTKGVHPAKVTVIHRAYDARTPFQNGSGKRLNINHVHPVVLFSHHEDHLDELRGIVGKTAAEPEEGQHTTKADVCLEHLTDGHPCVAGQLRLPHKIHTTSREIGALSKHRGLGDLNFSP